MDASTIRKKTRIEQCKHNAQAKSEKKRQAAYEAIARLRREGYALTRAAVAKEASVSVVFLRSHPDLVQAIEAAQGTPGRKPELRSNETSKEQVIAAFRRRLEEMKQKLAAKEAQLQQKQREIDRLYGKLAAGSGLTQAELSVALTEALQRIICLEEQLAVHALPSSS